MLRPSGKKAIKLRKRCKMSNKIPLINHLYSYVENNKMVKIQRNNVIKLVNNQGHTDIFGYDLRPLYMGLVGFTKHSKHHARLEIIRGRYGVRGV